MLISLSVRPHLDHLTRVLHGYDPRLVAGIAAGAAVGIAAFWYLERSHRPTPAELERRRRDFLSSHGRITDGVIVDKRTLGGEESYTPAPEVIVYSYRMAGVVYECAQDVSPFPEQVTDCRLDQAIQVRYDPRNPGNSMLVSESWTGLWRPGKPRV